MSVPHITAARHHQGNAASPRSMMLPPHAPLSVRSGTECANARSATPSTPGTPSSGRASVEGLPGTYRSAV